MPQKSKQELEVLCEKYYLDIYKYCAARVDMLYAEDIANDVFLLFCQKWQKLEDINYKSWLYETAQNLIKNHYKMLKRKTKNETHIDDSVAENLSYEENFENIGEDKTEERKNEIINSLTERDRQLYEMKYVEKMPNNQIRETLSLSEDALEKRLYRLKQKIAVKISEKSK